MRLQNKAAIVTGAASGIGHAIAARFVAEGASVLAVDWNRDAGRAVTAGLVGTGERSPFTRPMCRKRMR